MTYYVIICPCCSNKYKMYFPQGTAFCDFCHCLWEYKAIYEMGNTVDTTKSIQEIETMKSSPETQ